jgi:quercetin dioxygenase-like cupin family protein
LCFIFDPTLTDKEQLMNCRAKVITATAVAVCGIAGLAIATPQVGVLFNWPAVSGAINKDVHDHVHMNLSSNTGENEENEWNGEFSTEGASNFAFADVNIVANGGHTGWHTHPGILLVSVASGAIEWYDAQCKRTVYNAGDSLTETNKPHYVRNIGTVDSRLLIAYVIPKDMPRRIDIPFDNIPACAHAAGIDN